MCVSAYLLGLIKGDGGLYVLRYRGGRTEYRVVITQRSSDFVKRVVELMEGLVRDLGIKAKVQVIRGRTRYEIRVSSKALYQYFAGLSAGVESLSGDCRLAFIKGLYEAEGDKSGRRVRLWNKDQKLLELVCRWLGELGIGCVIYLDDKRRGVYVLEVPSPWRGEFFRIFGTAPAPR